MDGSVQGTWYNTAPGETVTVTCAEKLKLFGSPERTCLDREWNADVPICSSKYPPMRLGYLYPQGAGISRVGVTS